MRRLAHHRIQFALLAFALLSPSPARSQIGDPIVYDPVRPQPLPSAPAPFAAPIDWPVPTSEQTTTYSTVYPSRSMSIATESTPADSPLFDECVPDVFGRHRVWGEVDFVLMATRRAPIGVPLVTTGPANDPLAGYLSSANTRIVIGNETFNQGISSGGRLRAGFWFDDYKSLGLEFAGFLVASPRSSITTGSNGDVVLSRPVDLPTGPGVYDIAFPTFVRGSFLVESIQRFGGAEANFVGFLIGDQRFSFEVLGGLRFLSLEESLRLRYQVNNLQPMLAFGGDLLPVDSLITAVDSYSTRNHFYGGQVGGRLDWNYGKFNLGASAKLALGVNDQRLTINGSTTRFDGATSLYAGGVFANASNIGRYDTSRFAMVPEFGLKAGWWITPNIRVHLGYNLILWTDVLRPGNQISRSVDPALVPLDRNFNPLNPVNRVTPTYLRSDFWAEGLILGLDFRF